MSAARLLGCWRGRGAAVVLAAAFVWGAALYAARAASMPRDWFRSTSEFGGEALLHRLPDAYVDYHMPMDTLAEALLLDHAGPGARAAWLAALALAQMLLIAAAAALAGSPRAALLAGCLFLWAGRGGLEAGGCVQFLYSIPVLAAVAVSCWSRRAPTPVKSALAGLAIGATLLFRSPLFALPPLLGLAGALDERGSRRARAWHLLALCLVPYLALVPWIGMNWSIDRRLVLFERGEAHGPVVTGAVGIVPVVEADWRAVVPDAPDASGGVYAWAAKQVLLHPLRYAWGCVDRAFFIARASPLLFLGAALAAWLLRRRGPMRPAILMFFYFWGIHCLLSSRPAFIVPIFPVACVLIACALADAGLPEPGSPGLRRAAAVLLLILAAPVLAFAAYAEYKVVDWTLAGGPRADYDERLDAAIASAPADPWLRAARGRRALAAGRSKEALADLEIAAAARPDDERIQLAFATALAREGRPERLLRLRGGVENEIAKAVHFLRARDLHEAARHWEEAYREFLDARHLWRAETARERELEAALRGSGSDWRRETILQVEESLPRSERPLVLEGLSGLFPADRFVLLEAAAAESDAGRPKKARGLLERAAALGPDAPERRRIALLYAGLGDAGRAVQVLEPPAPSAAFWLETGRSFLRERRELAAACAARAAALDPDARELAGAVSLFAAAGDPAAAMKSLAPLARRSSAPSSFYLDAARAAAEESDPTLASRCLEKALALGPGRPGLEEIARMYAELGQWDGAMRALAPLARGAADPEAYWFAAGETALKKGRWSLAMRCLDQAAALKPAESERRRIAERYELARRGESGGRELPDTASSWLAKAEAGSGPAALEALRQARAASPSDGELRRIAALYERLGKMPEGLEAVSALVSSRASLDPEYWAQQAELAANASRPTLALQCLVRALDGAATGSDDELAARAEALSRPRSRSPRFWLAGARASLRIARTRLARTFVERAAQGRPSEESLQSAAEILQELEDCPSALRLLDRLIAASPRNASAYKLRGICRYLSKDPAAARADLEKSVQLEPGLLSARLSLIALHDGAGRRGEAAEACRAARAQAPRPDETELASALKAACARVEGRP